MEISEIWKGWHWVVHRAGWKMGGACKRIQQMRKGVFLQTNVKLTGLEGIRPDGRDPYIITKHPVGVGRQARGGALSAESAKS